MMQGSYCSVCTVRVDKSNCFARGQRVTNCKSCELFIAAICRRIN